MKRLRIILSICLIHMLTAGAAVVYADTAEPVTMTLTQMVAGIRQERLKDDGENIFNVVSTDLFDYELGYGSVEKGQLFPYDDLPADNQQRLLTKQVYTSTYAASALSGGANYIRSYYNSTWDKCYYPIIKITAKQDMKITITNGESELHTAGKNNLVNSLRVVIYVSCNQEDIAVAKVADVKFLDDEAGKVVENSLGGDFHIKAGWSLYYEYKALNHAVVQTINNQEGSVKNTEAIKPTFKFDAAAYDSSKIYDFDTLINFKNGIAESIQRLENYLEEIDLNEYSFDNQLNIAYIIDEAIKELEKAELGFDYEAFMEEVLGELQAIKTYKDECKDLLQQHYNSFDLTKYSDDGKKSLSDYLAQGKAAIDEATSLEDAKAILDQYKGYMNSVQQTAGNDKKGCKTYAQGGSVALILGICALLSLVLIERKRHSEMV